MCATTLSIAAASASVAAIGAICLPYTSSSCAPRAPFLIIQDLLAQVPLTLTCDLRCIQRLHTLAFLTVAGRTNSVLGSADLRIASRSCAVLRTGWLLRKPGFEVFLLFNDDCATHRVMRNAAKLFAQHFESSRHGRRQPKEGIMPGTRSILTRNSATVKLCSTSLERSRNLTGLSTGRCASGL